MAEYPDSPYTVKNYRHFNGHDGQGFELSLYKDGKRIGTVSDDGWGGGYIYHLDAGEEQALCDYAASLPTEHVHGMDLQPDADMVVYAALEPLFGELDRKEAVKQLTRWSKTKTVFLLAGEDGEKDGYRTLKAPYAENTLAYLRKEHGGSGATVWNPGTKAFEAV